MKQLRAFLDLSAADRRLLVEAYGAAVIARIGLSLTDLGRLRRWASRRGTRGRPAGRVAWAVRVACRRVPAATCLVSSLALQRLLSRHGHESELHIGVARHGDALAAHAWIECGGELFDGVGADETYTRLVAWRASDAA